MNSSIDDDTTMDERSYAWDFAESARAKLRFIEELEKRLDNLDDEPLASKSGTQHTAAQVSDQSFALHESFVVTRASAPGRIGSF